MSRFVVSCTNDREGGGLYLCDTQQASIERRYNTQCMGLSKSGSFYVVASQSLGLENFSPSSEGQGIARHVPHSIVCLDEEFRVASEAPVSHLGMGDLHDVILVDDEVWVADTLR